MYNKFKVKKKIISIALALVMASSSIASLPMHVFAGTGENGVIKASELVKFVQIKNKPSIPLLIFAPDGIISGAGRRPAVAIDFEAQEAIVDAQEVIVDAPEVIVDAPKGAQYSIKWEIVSGNKNDTATIDPETGQIKIDPSKYTASGPCTLEIKATVANKSDSYKLTINVVNSEDDTDFFTLATNAIKTAYAAADQAKKSVEYPIVELIKVANELGFENVATPTIKNSYVFQRATNKIEDDYDLNQMWSHKTSYAYWEAFTFILNKALKNPENAAYNRAARIALAANNVTRAESDCDIFDQTFKSFVAELTENQENLESLSQAHTAYVICAYIYTVLGNDANANVAQTMAAYLMPFMEEEMFEWEPWETIELPWEP